jgi:hypothetical protein
LIPASDRMVLCLAFHHWIEHVAYFQVDRRGRKSYRIKREYSDTGRSVIAPWSKTAVRAYPDNAAFHKAAHLWNAAFQMPEHTPRTRGLCSICGHYGGDCTANQKPRATP